MLVKCIFETDAGRPTISGCSPSPANWYSLRSRAGHRHSTEFGVAVLLHRHAYLPICQHTIECVSETPGEGRSPVGGSAVSVSPLKRTRFCVGAGERPCGIAFEHHPREVALEA